MKTLEALWITGIRKTLLTLTLLVGMSATTYSQDSLVYLSPNDIWWLSDSVQVEVAKKLTERVTLIQKDSLCNVEKENLLFQLGVINDKVFLYKKEVETLNSIIEDKNAKIFFYDEKIALRDRKIFKLKATNWIVIGVSGAAVIGTIVLVTQLK
jgi:hypothetical protein